MTSKLVQLLPLGRHSNSGSLLAALEKLGLQVRWIRSGETVDDDRPLLIPGVGTFSGAMNFLQSTGLDIEILRHGGKNSPLVGICLGFQILHSKGAEGAEANIDGLGLLPGHVESLGDMQHKLNVGWRRVYSQKNSRKKNEYFYFCHSYFVRPQDATLQVCNFQDMEITASSEKGNLIGYQFHPELSGLEGLSRLARDLKL